MVMSAKPKNIGTNALALGLVAAAVGLLVFKHHQTSTRTRKSAC